MIKKTNIFSGESEFRQFIIENWKYINDIILFEDVGENVIYFYALNDHIIAAAKEKTIENFSKYAKIYKYLSIKYSFDIASSEEDSMKLIKHR